MLVGLLRKWFKKWSKLKRKKFSQVSFNWRLFHATACSHVSSSASRLQRVCWPSWQKPVSSGRQFSSSCLTWLLFSWSLHRIPSWPPPALHCVGHVVIVPQPGSKMGPSVPCQLLRAAFMLFTSPPWQVAGCAHVQVTEQLQWTRLLLHISKYFETEICLLTCFRFLSSCLAPSCWNLEMDCRRELFIWSFRFSEDGCLWHNSHWFLLTDTASSINQLLFSSVSLGFLNILLVCCQTHLFRCLVHG